MTVRALDQWAPEAGCAHCGLPLPRAPHPHEADDGTMRLFCCHACRLVFLAIHDAGLDAYYTRRGLPPLRAADLPEEMAWLNQPEVQASYVTAHDGVVEGSYVLDGLHCAACSWLIEQSVEGLEGVCEARVNYATSRLRVRWEEGRTGLGNVAHRVAAIGYRATPYHPQQLERPRQRQANTLIMRMAVAGFCAGNVMLAAAALYCGALTGMDASFHRFFNWVGLVLCVPIILYSAVPFYQGAISALRAATMTMDVPICIGLLTTFTYSVWVTLADRGEVYFDTVAMFVFVLLIGRVVENASRGRVSSAVERLLSLGARAARVMRGGMPIEVPVGELVTGDQVEVLQGDRLPVDGAVVDGSAWIDESMLTGESLPRAVEAGADVSAGTVCTDGRLLIEATRTGSATTLAQISRMVEDAQMRRAPVQRIVDGVARWFVLVTIGLAIATGLFWHARGSADALMIAISVLIITCPCALGLATPLAVACACGRSASHGVLFRGGDVLEKLQGVTHVLLDKTGTLTEGRLEVVEVLTLDGADAGAALRLAAAVESQSTHPVARALLAAAPSRDLGATSHESAPGLGVSAWVDGREVLVGSADWLDRRGVSRPSRLESTAARRAVLGSTIVWLAADGHAQCAFALSDRVRPEARDVVQMLQRRGLQVELVSGDGPGAVEGVARATGITCARSRLLPRDKADVVRALQQSGARVALVGDGINDAPALSVADVGIAVASGTEVAMEAADVVLLRTGLEPLVEALQTARDAFATIRDNVSISAMYNLIALPTAVAGYVAPLLAAVAMPLSSLLVVGSSMRLWRPPHVGQPRPGVPRNGRLSAETHSTTVLERREA